MSHPSRDWVDGLMVFNPIYMIYILSNYIQHYIIRKVIFDIYIFIIWYFLMFSQKWATRWNPPLHTSPTQKRTNDTTVRPVPRPQSQQLHQRLRGETTSGLTDGHGTWSNKINRGPASKRSDLKDLIHDRYRYISLMFAGRASLPVFAFGLPGNSVETVFDAP